MMRSRKLFKMGKHTDETDRTDFLLTLGLCYKDITDKILKSFYKVYNTLGYGFLESVYERALFLELRKQKLFVQKQSPIDVF